MDPSHQSSGGRDGGRRPPRVACGFFGESDDRREHKNARERRAKKRDDHPDFVDAASNRIAVLDRLRRLVSGWRAEIGQVCWPGNLELAIGSFSAVAFSTLLSVTLYGFGTVFETL